MPQEMKEVPVYLFTGFLGSGKTTFIQDAMEGEDFNSNEDRTLLLLCEEGEIELHPAKFYGPNVFIETVEQESDLTPEHLDELLKKHQAERVVVEYNGMWGLDSFYQNMPEAWIAYQEMTFCDARTFLMFNQNMRQQTFDKLNSAELVVFNRCVRDDNFEDFQKQAHKIVRVANRKSQILYEFGPDDVIMDNLEDPLPYDLTQDRINIEDDWYAEWYRDVNDHPEKYEGKEFRVKGRAAVGEGLAKDQFIFGRHVMTCCVQDIQFAGLLCQWTDQAQTLKNGEWVKVRFTVKNEYTPIYQEEGPVLYVQTLAPCEPTEPEVATF